MITQKSDLIFLLGGYDLEMLEIRNILHTHGLKFLDKHLAWGAKLSDYRDEFDNMYTFVGIELIQDTEPPEHYIDINHHNEKVKKDSSLEQVIALLKSKLGIEIELTRELQLVAANDKGYIPALQQMGAKPNEIADIRRRDREAQGITTEDELLAEQSICENGTNVAGITIIKSLTSRFAAITDRLFPCSKLLIYTEQELTYYGEDVSLLIIANEDLIKQKKAYYGGGENGFFGIGFNNLPTRELIKTKNKILSILTNPTK